MKNLAAILIGSLVAFGALAQTRTYSDNESKTFIIGLENYFYGLSGMLEVNGCNVAIQDGVVSVGDVVLEEGSADAVIGAHDFTGNRVPELVVARRSAGAVSVTVYAFSGGSWAVVGRAGSPDAGEIRVFRQVISIRRGDALLSWTWHGSKFDFKSSDGSPEPVL